MSGPRARAGRRWWLAAGAVALVLAAVVSHYASDRPDGLERVAADEGFLAAADDHDLADGPLADYGVEAGRVPGLTGTWIPSRAAKLGAIGVRISRWELCTMVTVELSGPPFVSR